ncbi:hypothetical protein [Sporisorium scitamineum]|uniref:Uncharacterized protein n=1 Tax=Sporisorium scitamineum TaxID=49012 RepID=A0A0F7S5C4_9BASI|nr:hypothetical protein [Sporisorium scitamineum]
MQLQSPSPSPDFSALVVQLGALHCPRGSRLAIVDIGQFCGHCIL